MNLPITQCLLLCGLTALAITTPAVCQETQRQRVIPEREVQEASRDSSKIAKAIQGLWVGFVGGGQRDGVTYQPISVEILIKGDHIEMVDYPSTIKGTFHLDVKAKQLKITPSDESTGKTTAKTLVYGYELQPDKLTIFDGKRSVTFHKRNTLVAPLVNAQIDLVTAEGINDSGDLLAPNGFLGSKA